MKPRQLPKRSEHKEIDILNAFLLAELSATESYRLSIQLLEGERLIELQSNFSSHGERVGILSARIVELGGEPTQECRVWASFARLIEEDTGLLDRDAVIAALVEGEEIGLADYRKGVPDLSADSRALLENELLPAQQSSYRTMCDLRGDTQ